MTTNHQYQQILTCTTQLEYDDAKTWSESMYSVGGEREGLFQIIYDDANKKITFTRNDVVALGNNIWNVV